MLVSKILRSKTRLDQELEQFRGLLIKACAYEFWRRHFQNRDFNFEPEKFDWDYWQKIPFFTKDDFFRVGLNARMQDVGIGNREDARNLVLRFTSGTTQSHEPLATLRRLPARSIGMLRTICLFEPFATGLLCASSSHRLFRETGESRQILSLDPFHINTRMSSAIRDFCFDGIDAFPNSLAKFASIFPEQRQFNFASPKVRLSGDFLSETQKSIILRAFPDMILNMYYGLSEFGPIGKPCRYLKKRYGFNAYHLRQVNQINELVDINEEGYGEVVSTRFNPPKCDFALIRYRTGDIAKAIEEDCECGAVYTLILTGRKNFDYVKCAGTMIVRQELERVMSMLKKYVVEWRAEAREFVQENVLIGELTLKIRATPEFISSKRAVPLLASQISRNLYLTPTDTLDFLVNKRKFHPLKIELVESFPETKKPLLLRRAD